MKTTLSIEGTQHPTITPKLSELYKQLFNLIPENLDKSKFAKFFPMVGTKYKKSSPKIMLVGRCPNGWRGFEDNETIDSFVSSAADQMVSEDGFNWINKDNHISEYTITQDGKTTTEQYNINSSAFWRVTKSVVYKCKPWLEEHKKLGVELTQDHIKGIDNNITCWFEHIVWTNIFPIAPLNGGNTSEKLKRITKNVCADLLLEQIKFYKPTHIIFITDWDYWFSDIAEKFPNVKKISENSNDNIVGLGEIDGVKTIVTRRPETRGNEEMAEDIFESLFNN